MPIMKKSLKKTFVFLIVFWLGFFCVSNPLLAVAEEISDGGMVIHFFDDRLCPVCQDTKNFINSILENYPEVEFKIYSISDIPKLSQVAEDHGIVDYNIMAPTIFIGDNFFQFRDFTERNKAMIVNALSGKTVEEAGSFIKIPVSNIEIDTSNLSLPAITAILASVDGLNVCSIGALILVLTIVMVLDSKKQIFFYGGLFILTSATIYGLLVFVWGKLFELLIGQLEILRVIVGLAALAGGIYFTKEFWRYFKYGPTCKTIDSKLIANASKRLKQAFDKPGRQTTLLVSSVVFFAAVVTIVELPCSVGIPVAFAGVLAEAGVSLWSYIFYILLYLLFYMLIEIILFIGAVVTKKVWFVNSKMITWITLLGALVLFYLAFYYLFS